MSLRLVPILILVVIIQGCILFTTNKKRKAWVTKIPESEKKIDIPKYDGETPYVYWHWSKQKEKQLNLISPETGSQDLVFRMWVTSQGRTKGQNHGLVEIVKTDSIWVGKVTHMKVDFRPYKYVETITKQNTSLIEPINGWKNLIDSLNFYQFSKLVSDKRSNESGPNEQGYNTYSPTYCFEYATPSVYRFYQLNYSNIVNNLIYKNYSNGNKIINLLDKEFKTDSLADLFFLN
ncbi:MAG: hypothetical protein ACPGVD_02565 [Flavobacteriales bacterium]